MKHRDSLLSYFARYRASDNPRERAKRAGRPERRSAARRQSRRRAAGVRYSDEALSALTRGLYIPVSDDRRAPEHAPQGAFEETYSRYPFAPLVRMAIALVELFSRYRRG